MKKILAILLVLCSLISAVGIAEADPIELKLIIGLYSTNTEPYLLEVIDKFEAANPGVKVTLEVLGWDVKSERINALVGSDVAPDMYVASSAGQFVEDEMLYDVQDIISEELQADFYAPMWANCVDTKNDGAVWLMPLVASVRFLYYNKTMFDEVGIEAPKTWKDVEDCCAKLKEFYGDEVYPLGIDASTTEGYTLPNYFGVNNGGGYLDADKNWAINSAANVEAMEWLYGLYQKGYTNPNPVIETRDDMQRLMGVGKVAMMISMNTLPTLYPDVDLEVAAIPYNDANVDKSSPMAVVDGLMIFNDSVKAEKDTPEKKQAIADFLDFLYSPEIYAQFVANEGFLACTTQCGDFIAANDAEQKVMYDSVSSAVFNPTAKTEWMDVRVEFADAIGLVFTGAASVQDALDSVQAIVE